MNGLIKRENYIRQLEKLKDEHIIKENMDVSQNIALTALWCCDNQLTALDVSRNTALTFLNCEGNFLTALDVSANTALTTLFAGNRGSIETIGVYVGQRISDFISIFEKQYRVQKGTISLEGEDYDGYHVFENDEELFFAFTPNDNSNIVSRVWVFSPQYNTEKGIGVGATVADINSNYKISDIMGVAQYIAVEGSSAIFGIGGQFPEGYWEEENPKLPETHIVRVVIVNESDLMVTNDKRIIIIEN